MNREDIEYVLEVLRSCWAELEAMESTYDDYAVAGHLAEQVEIAIELLEGSRDVE